MRGKASTAVSAETHFENAEDRADSIREFLKATEALLDEYRAQRGATYRVVLSAHPQAEGSKS